MIMKIELSEEKARTQQWEIEDCYEWLDMYFKEKGIKKVSQGIYQCDDYGDMAYAQVKLPKTGWFLNVVDKWACNFVSNDMNQYMEDCLDAYYWVEARNP